jgi:N6-L-threonylcarbamoyladenine synthase
MTALGLESTCDDTSAALVKNGREILAHTIASSADIQEKYGGVFPELACRRHIEVIRPVIEETFAKAKISPQDIDLIAVAKGPGLVGALLIGMQMAKGLAIAWNKPLIGVNHVEAHLYAALMGVQTPWPLPALGIVLSGGHTLLVKVNAIGSYERIGTTVDDAIGEAFDKVAVLLGLPYPGGPPIEKLAQQGNPQAHRFTTGRVKKNPMDFSFSGLKTSVRHAFEKQHLSAADLAASFQETAFRDVLQKAELAIQTFPCQAILFGGGVCNNRRLRQMFAEKFPHLPLLWPEGLLSSDNGAMIAGLGYHRYLQQGKGDPLDLEVGCIKGCL